MLNKKEPGGDCDPGPTETSPPQIVGSYSTCLHDAYPGFCSVSLNRVSVDLDTSVKDRLHAGSNPLCRQQNETALWNGIIKSLCNERWVLTADLQLSNGLV